MALVSFSGLLAAAGVSPIANRASRSLKLETNLDSEQDYSMSLALVACSCYTTNKQQSGWSMCTAPAFSPEDQAVRANRQRKCSYLV